MSAARDDAATGVAVAEGAVREPLQELSRPSLMDVGRLRLLDYPVLGAAAGRVEQLELSTRTYRDATALPLARSEVRHGHRKIGAVYTRRGRLVRDSERAYGKPGGQWHSNEPTLARKLPSRRTVSLAGRSFFLGHWSPGFGHVLLEMLPRLWPAQDYSSYDHFVVYPRRHDKSPRLRRTPWLHDLLGACGVAVEKLVIVRDEPVSCASLDVTTSSFVLKSAADPRFLHVFDAMSSRILGGNPASASSGLPARIYLSRSQVRARCAANEEEIETALQRRGFTVLHPQNLTIAEQVRVIAHAQVIVGGDGSALHLGVFARPGTKLLALDSRIVTSQFVVDRVRGLDAVHLLAVDAVIHRRAKWIADIGQVHAALDLLLAS